MSDFTEKLQELSRFTATFKEGRVTTCPRYCLALIWKVCFEPPDSLSDEPTVFIYDKNGTFLYSYKVIEA